MKKSFFISLLFALIVDTISVDRNICNKLQKLKDFKSKVIFRYNEREYHIEEFRSNNKGKLIINDDEGEIKEIYYINHDYENSKEIRIAFYNRKSNECSTYEIRNKSELEAPYKFFDLKSGIYGPSALYASIQDRLEKFTYEEELTDDRGIDSHVCKAFNLELPKLSHTIFRLHISDLSWTIFDQKNENIPQLLKFNIISADAIDPNNGEVAFGVEIEYLKFETIDLNNKNNLRIYNSEFEEDENQWVVPSNCFDFNKIIPKIELPDKLKVTLDEMIDKTVLNRFNVIYDRVNDFYQFEKIEKDQKVTKLIKLGLNFYIETKDEECLYHSGTDFYLTDLKLDKIFVYLYDLKDNYYGYIGSQIVRNILTDVYKIHSKSEDGQRFIYTIYVQKKLSDMNEGYFTHIPVQFKIERLIENGNELEETTVYNFYDFKKIENDDEYASGFDISECDFPNSKVSFNLIAKNELIDEKMEKQDEIDLKAKLRELVQKTIKIKPINLPKIEVKINNKEIISTIEYRDYSSPLMYFYEQIIAIYDNKTDEKDKIFETKKTIEACAIESLKDVESIGFQFCDFKTDKYCHVLTKANLNYNKLIIRKSAEGCELRKKSKNKQITSEWANDKVKKISDASKNNQLIVDHLDVKFNFNKIHFIKDKLVIDRSKLFELISRGRSYLSDLTQKTISYEEGSINPTICYQQCMNPKNNFTCDAFSFCKRLDENYECNLISLIDNQNSHEYDTISVKDDNCDIYSVSILKHFQEHSDKKLSEKDVKIIDEIKMDHKKSASSDCALNCLNHNKKTKNEDDHCLSIEVCKNDEITNCKLSQNNTLWANEKVVVKDLNCVVYSVKHILNFHPTTQTKLENFISEPVNSQDHCATRCDMSGDCHIFNYCDTESGKFCHYIRDSIKGSGKIELESDLLGCVTYIHRNQFIGAPLLDKAQIETKYINKNTGIGFTAGSVMAFIFLSIIVGFIIGSDGVYIYKTKYSKGNERSNLTLRFSVNSTAEEALENDQL